MPISLDYRLYGWEDRFEYSLLKLMGVVLELPQREFGLESLLEKIETKNSGKAAFFMCLRVR